MTQTNTLEKPNTALTKAEEIQPVQMTKGDVKRLIEYIVSETKELTFSSNGAGGDMSFAELKLWGGMMKEAGMIPAAKEGGVQPSEQMLIARGMAKIVAGKQWGFDPVSSQSLLHFIPTSGTIVPDYKALSARLLGSGKYRYRITEHTNETCTAIPSRLENGRWVDLDAVTYTLEDAKTAGLYSQARADGTDKYPDGNPKKKGAWEAHTKDMLFSKVVRRIFNRHCADLYVMGVPPKTTDDYQEEEIAAAAPKQLQAANPDDEPFFTQESAPVEAETSPTERAEPVNEVEETEEQNLFDHVAAGIDALIPVKKREDWIGSFGVPGQILENAAPHQLKEMKSALALLAAKSGGQ